MSGGPSINKTWSRTSLPLDLWAAFVVLAVGLAFWLPAFSRTGGHFPVPLDDVYIHFAFARSAALGHPFEWSIGNGYSSGGTSLTYPLVLAPGWLLGFRGDKLAWFAAIITCLCLWDTCRSIRHFLGPSPKTILCLVPLLLLSVPLADWSFYSGMETALFAAILGRFVVSANKATTTEPSLRASAQFKAGLWGALLVATRPEAAAIAGPMGIAIVYAARSLGTIASLLRALGPMFAFLAAQASANLLLTSEASQAGAVRKLVGTNPYITPAESAIEVLKNIVVLRTQAFDAALGGAPFSFAPLALALVAMASRRMRLAAWPLVLGAVGMLLLVSLNTTARYQNLRYAVPSLLAILMAAAMGLRALAGNGRATHLVAIVLGIVVVVAPARHFARQIDHFARASANIEGQQVVVGRRLGEQIPKPRRVFLGDAGAIPYFSGLPALDGLGLGGYHDFPFARASVHGVPAVIELIERLPETERPDILAIYPSWWPDIAQSFGKELFSVHIDDNVMCAAPDKVVYAADWSTLAKNDETRPGVIDEIDVGDLVSERAHRYAFPRPQGGWIIGTAWKDAQGQKRYDAGRIIPEGRTVAFTLSSSISPGPARLVLRTDLDAPATIRVELLRADHVVFREERAIVARIAESWGEVIFDVADVKGGDRVQITAVANAWRHHHAWLLRD